MKYRSEIDGLRALAVISVTVFHFFPNSQGSGFSGYLGVDVFFVISGFLISKYIYAGLQAEKFSFKEFYWRRVKRILPAALFTLLLTSIAAILILTPYDLSSYFKSQLSVLSFIPNVFFWRTGGYFGDIDALKPLLHYWSLGVEEQFYLFYPLTLFLSYKLLGKGSLFYSVAAISAVSLILNIYLLKIGGANPAFFLLPTRVWEFGIGCLGAILAERLSITIRPMASNALLLALLASFFVLPPETVPQGLLPSILTGLILFYSHPDGAAYKILSSQVSTFFGKISFSLYLIHWPVVVFLGYIVVDAVAPLLVIAALGITVLASYLSYRFIELPFRHDLDKGVVGRVLLALTVVLVGISLVGTNSKLLQLNSSQLVADLSNQIQTNYRCPITAYRSFGGSRACVINGEFDPSATELVLVGNSHAQMYTPIVKSQTKDTRGILVPLIGCLPTTEVNISPQCLNLARQNQAAVSQLPALKRIVVGMTWYFGDFYSEKGRVGKQELIDDLMSSIELYEELGVEVFVVSPLPIPRFNHASELSRKLKFGHISNSEYLELSRIPFSQFFDDVAIFDEPLRVKLGTRYIKAYEKMCDDEYCYFGDLGGSYFSDENHLSNYGVSLLSPLFTVIDPK